MTRYAMVVVVDAPDADDAHQQAARAGESVYVSDAREVTDIDLARGGYWTSVAKPDIQPAEDETIFVLHADDGYG